MNKAESVSDNCVIDIEKLSRSFGSKLALDNVSLRVPSGGVFALIGKNGAGKTTLIKHLLGLYRAEKGSVRVFSHDPVSHPVQVLSRVGCVSEDRELPGWLRVRELMDFTRSFYPAWDNQYAEELRVMFDLDPKQQICKLSRGQAARMCLLLALAHRPDLLILDEPSSGLDPVVRRDILAAIVRTIADEGRTVLFSSHLLDEVERVADRIAIIHDGQVILEGELDAIQESFHRITFRFENDFQEAPAILGAIENKGKGKQWTYVCRGDREQVISAARTLNAEIVQETSVSLDDIFICSISHD